MAVKKWQITGHILHDTQNVKTVKVEANGFDKAKQKGLDMIKKKYKTDAVNIDAVEQLDDDGNVIA